MATPNPTPEERASLVTRFLVVFVICILCALIPLWFLFSLPDKAIHKLKVTSTASKGQEDKVEAFRKLTLKLDSLWKDKNFESGYNPTFDNVYGFVENDLDPNDPYFPLFVRIRAFYDSVRKDHKRWEANAEVLKELNGKVTDLEKEKKDLEKKLLEAKLNAPN